MATSTETSVRTAIVDAIKGINDGLGLDNDDNIFAYLLAVARDEDTASYLYGDVGGKKKIRAWGVQVVGETPFYKMQNGVARTYRITVQGYYDVGDINVLIEGTSRVQKAITDLNATIGSRVTVTESYAVTDPIKEDTLDGENYVTQSIFIEAFDASPDFFS